ncbi:unnamed protein product, partial [Brassica rapa subsp. narinosa]
ISKGENSVFIPMDLINEIFSRLPAKSVARFSCFIPMDLMLDRSYFKELFFIRSSARPRLLFSVKQDGYDDLCLFSSPQPCDLYEKSSSLVITADFHMKHQDMKNMPLVLSISLGALLPEDNRLSSINYLVFDPVDKQFKVLNIMINYKGMLRTQTRNGWNMSTHFRRRINVLAAVTFPLYGRIKLLLGTATGDIVLCMEDVSKLLYVFYLDIERKTLQRVEFRTANNEAFEKCSSKVILSVDHVEDPNFINMET